MSKNYELLRAVRRDVELFRHESPAECSAGYAPEHHNGNGHGQPEILKLIARLFLLGGSSAPHVVVFCPVDHNACSSVICAQVGELLAGQVEDKICLINGDPVSPALDHYFGESFADSHENPATTHCGAKNGAHLIRGNNLWLLSGDLRPPVSDSVPASPVHLKERLSELTAQFKYVLFNAPPVNELAEALVLGRIADGVVLVIAANSTRRAAALKARQDLDALNIRILGAVLTQRAYPIPEALYRRL